MHNRLGAPYKFASKVILVGDAEAGKSALLQRLIHGDFLNKKYDPTIGVEFGSKISGGVKLALRDITGDERFRSISSNYYPNSHAVILTYDISNMDSFEHIETWIEDIKKASGIDSALFYLVGTKCDLEAKRKVGSLEVELAALEHHIPQENCFEVSARTNKGINKLFVKLTNDLTAKHQAETAIAAKNKATDNQPSPPFLQKHWRKIAVGIVTAATIAALTAVFWPAIIALPFVATGIFGIGGGLFAGIGIGAIGTAVSTAAGFVTDAVITAIDGNKIDVANVLNNDSQPVSPGNGSNRMISDLLGFDPATITSAPERALLLDNSLSNQQSSPRSTAPDTENDQFKPTL